MAKETGPGHTRWEPNDCGGINTIRHNDMSWTTTFASASDLQGDGQEPLTTYQRQRVSELLRKAYEQGLYDQGTLIRRALGVSDGFA